MKSIKEQFISNLVSLKKEIDSYPDETSLWLLTHHIKNTPANLALHLCGNLKHNIGAVIGKNNFVRERDLEFSRKGLSKSDIIIEIDFTAKMIEPVLDSLTDADLALPWPNDTFGPGQTVGSVLIRVGIHLGYHLGQINYHRRILTT